MSATITLPSPLRSRLNAILWRIRLLRAVRGAALVVVVLGSFAAAAGMADYWLDLPPLTRQVLVLTGLVLGVALLLRYVAAPLFRWIDAVALAALIEEKYPELGERLTSAVALTEDAGEGHGSPFFIALLLQETTNRSANLDFRPAVPARHAGGLIALAAATAFSIVSPAFLWPERYSAVTQRFLQPWVVPPVVQPYDIRVSPGDTSAACGRTLTLSAHLLPRDETVLLPDAATLLVMEADGKENRHVMQRETTDEFRLDYKTGDDFSYRIEAGGQVSDTFHVTAIAPVELAADSPTITVTPPAYARSVKDVETFHGLVDLSALQYSEIRFEFRFTRPAAAAYLEWKHGSKGNAARQPLRLSADRQAASWTLSDLTDRTYRVVLEAEHGIRTELEGGTIGVQPDQPPSVHRFSGKEELHAVLATERVPLEIEAVDDIAVAGIELEYRINEEEPVRQTLELQGGGTPTAIARYVLELAGKVKENDQVSYRFRVSDNLPPKYKGPHVLLYPADRWLALQIARRGDSLENQEIAAQRDDVKRRLESVREALLQEKNAVDKAREQARSPSDSQDGSLGMLKKLPEANRTNQRALREAAEVADATPALRPVGDTAREVAEQELQKSQQALDQAPKEAKPAQQARRLQDANQQLANAVKRVEDLIKTNDRLAQERLDRARLEQLAQREKGLAEQAAELAAKHPVLDPKAKQLAEKIQKAQAEAAKELDELAQHSEALKKTLQQAREEQARKLGQQALALAQAQRELARAEEQTQRQRLKERLADLARKQQELAEQSAKLAQETRPALPVTRTEPLKPEEAQRAADALKEGDPAEAMRRQDQAARDLERLAQALARAVKVAADPKEAARQLEQAEQALRQRVQEETNKKDAKQPLGERLKALEEEQKAIGQAAEQLSVPPNHAEAKKTKEQIGERAAQAAEALQKQNAPQAQAHMEEMRNQLHRLTDMLPNLDQRRQQALREVGRLRQQQEEIARGVEPIRNDNPKTAQRLADAARREEEAAKALNKLDAPNHEERRDRAAEAMQQALNDLREGRREDVPASQREAKRQLDRLAQALRGEKPADAQARELAQKQRQLAEEVKRMDPDADPTPPQKQDLKNRQQELANQARSLSAPEAPQRQREAGEAAQRAAEAAQSEPTSEETRRNMEEAARKLDALARQMAGEESAPEQAERLARKQTEAAQDAERRPGQEATPEEQRRQQEIAREARELPAGDEAQQQKRRALEALDRAQRTPAPERAGALRQAAEAMRDLADRLAGRDNAVAKANYLAQQQRDLARNVAQMQPDKTTPQQAKEAAARQTELAQQVRRLRSKEALPQIVETRTRMADAVVALTRAKAPAEAKQAVARAAESAEKLAEQLGKAEAAKPRPASPQRTTSLKPKQSAQPSANQRKVNTATTPPPRSLPTQQESEQARQLAQQQRALREAVQREAQSTRNERPVVRENPIEELARQQSQLAKQAKELSHGVTQEQGEEAPVSHRAKQAQQAAQETATKMAAGALPSALQSGRRSGDQLRQLAEEMAIALRRGEQRSPESFRQARRLNEKQEDINRRLQSLADQTNMQTAQQQAQQRNLQKQAGELSGQFQELARQPRTPGRMQAALHRAAGNSHQAEQAMEQADQQSQRGEPAAEQQTQERAAKALERAARDAAEAGKPPQHASAPAGPPSAEAAQPGAGDAVEQACKQMADAQGQLQQGNPAKAGSAMRQAAQALARAAKQMVPGSPQPDSSGQTLGPGKQPGGLPDLSALGLDKTAYAGKSWGELPGELRTKIVQDMKARYGEDYARMIKSYFEQIADTKRKENKATRSGETQ